MSEFRELYDEDQKAIRKAKKFLASDATAKTKRCYNIEWGKRCLKRLQQVEQLMRFKRPTEPADFYFAAMIYQHSVNAADYAMAHLLALQAHQLGFRGKKEDGSDPLWLAAAARDRFQISLELPQDFGTQWQQNLNGSLVERYPVNPNFTDEERVEWNVPPLNKKD